jgi:hypothetical protein
MVPWPVAWPRYKQTNKHASHKNNKAKGRPALHKVKNFSTKNIFFSDSSHPVSTKIYLAATYLAIIFTQKSHKKYVHRLLKLVVPLWWGLVWGLAGASPPLRDWHHAGRVGDWAACAIEGQVALLVCRAVSQPLAPMKPPHHYYFAPLLFCPLLFCPTIMHP